jgi:predicted DNA-binding transcriptional regulator AlpA
MREAVAAPPTALMDADEVARELRVSLRTVRRLDLTGQLPAPLKLGGIHGRALRWRRMELLDWILAGAPPRDSWHWEPHCV